MWRITVGNIQKKLDDERQGVVYFSHKKVFIFFWIVMKTFSRKKFLQKLAIFVRTMDEYTRRRRARNEEAIFGVVDGLHHDHWQSRGMQ